MKNKEFIDGGDLFVARVRVVLEDDIETGARRTAHYNALGYRLFLRKDDKHFIDILTGDIFPLFSDNIKVHQLYILDPKPFWTYAHSLRMKEKVEDVIEIAKYVSDHFNAYMHDEKKWKEAKDQLHKIHHKNDKEKTF
ncbi:MAG: hypothetical protein E7359_03710 [Clostridiales bacterium]|nr:hypothetical protein [Clostridiales bacterium]